MSDTWIEEQKKLKLFEGPGKSGDAIKMLEKSPGNRVMSATQAKQFTSARFIGKLLGIECLDELCDALEFAQMCVDKDSREDFMRVAIEQWQGKLAAGKRFIMENLVQ